jgi:hypothetical protein
MDKKKIKNNLKLYENINFLKYPMKWPRHKKLLKMLKTFLTRLKIVCTILKIYLIFLFIFKNISSFSFD